MFGQIQNWGLLYRAAIARSSRAPYCIHGEDRRRGFRCRTEIDRYSGRDARAEGVIICSFWPKHQPRDVMLFDQYNSQHQAKQRHWQRQQPMTAYFNFAATDGFAYQSYLNGACYACTLVQIQSIEVSNAWKLRILGPHASQYRISKGLDSVDHHVCLHRILADTLVWDCPIN